MLVGWALFGLIDTFADCKLQVICISGCQLIQQNAMFYSKQFWIDDN